MIEIGEKWCFAGNPDGEQLRMRGAVLTAVVVGLTYLVTWGLTAASFALAPVAGFLVSVCLIYFVLCTRSLSDAAVGVQKMLQLGDLGAARQRLSLIVGRDTAEMSETEISRAVIETVSENITDGIISPLFYLAIGGIPLAMAFKAVSTLDSMVGYKNARYHYLGWASARLDDLANYIPARLTGYLLMPLAAWLTGYDYKASFRTVRQEAKNHESPNSGYSEAAAAGALQVRLGGPASYGGILKEKKTIGTQYGPPSVEKIGEAVRLMQAASGLGLLAAAGVLLWLGNG